MAKHARLILVMLAGLLLAACSSAKGSTDATAAAGTSAGTTVGTTALKVGTSPTLSNASLYLATQNGAFANHHLAVTPQLVTSGAEAVPLLLNGQIQFTAADPLGALVAISQKVPLVIVAQANVVPANPAQDSTGLLVKASSPIGDAADFAGKTVAVNALNSLSQVTAEATIDEAGGNASAVRFVELPIPQMIAAVQRGTVDGAVLNEPYVTQAKAAGLRDVFPVMSKSVPGVPQLVYVAAKSYVASHPATVAAFAASIATADSDLSQSPSLIRSVGAKSTTVGSAVLGKIILPTFTSSALSVSSLATLETLMVKYKVLPQPLSNLGQYVFSGTPAS
jgi:NitT/TauT family transport system substrate-binding protein